MTTQMHSGFQSYKMTTTDNYVIIPSMLCRYPAMVKIPLENSLIRIVIRLISEIQSFAASNISHPYKVSYLLGV